MAQHKLSARRVETLNKRGHYGDGGNLYLQISQWHTKSWTFRYKLHGKIKEMGLGPLVLISLAEARDKALACRKLLLEGRDPIAARQHQREQAKLEAAKTITFAQCADSYIKAAEDGWRNQQHRYQWRQTIKAACDTKLGRSAGGTFGDLPVAKVDTGFVLQVLQPIWKVKPETASRTRQRIETVLNWATASEYRQGENPARWRGHLEHKLVKPRKLHSVQHHPALPYTDVPEFMTELRSDKSVAAKALEFTILSASRTGEVINASWNEIDMRAKTWTVPAKRMKSGKAHRVPLTDVALTLLSSLPRKRDNPFVFISGAKPLRAVAMLQFLKTMRPGITVHGFRSTFRDWAAAQTNFAREIVEKALAHTIRNMTERAYQRDDLLDKRRRLMADWARYCEQKPVASKSRVVVALRR